MSGSRSKHKTLIITDDDDQAVVEEEQNPFSFKEFLRSKNQESDPGQEEGSKSEDEQAWGRSWTPAKQIGSESFPAEQEEEVTRFDSHLHDEDEDEDEESSSDHEDPQATTLASLLQVKEENKQLKKTITELRKESLKNQTRASELSVELTQWRQREQQEALDLESMVQSVEHNLKVMTKRALKAEATVAKLKAEVEHLQAKVEQARAENMELRVSESEVVLMMRQNAQLASEKLLKTASHAQDSVRSLLSEAESLKFISELLQSIDRMSSA